MLKLRDIMTREVITVSPELSVRAAMELLVEKHVGGVPVVAGSTVVGVVSASDLLALAASLPGVPTERTDQVEAREWSEPRGWEEEAEAEPAAAYFTEMWADAGASVDERFSKVQGPEWNALEERTVEEAMTREVRSLPSTVDVTAAAEHMRRAGIHRVLVIDAGELAGIVTAMDVTRAVADHRVTSRTYAFNRERDFDERGWLPQSVPDGELADVPSAELPEPRGEGPVEAPAQEEAPRPADA